MELSALYTLDKIQLQALLAFLILIYTWLANVNLLSICAPRMRSQSDISKLVSLSLF